MDFPNSLLNEVGRYLLRDAEQNTAVPTLLITKTKLTFAAAPKDDSCSAICALCHVVVFPNRNKPARQSGRSL
jgi:hypothetical protein